MSHDFFGNLPIVSGMGFMRGILLLDDCEGTMNWTITGTGGDDVHEFATAAAFTGEKGFRLKTRTTGAAADDMIDAARIISFPESGLLVLRYRFASPDISNVKGIYQTAIINTGALQYQAQLLYNPNTPSMKYQDVSGAGVTIPALAYTLPDSAWADLELIVDCREMTYISAAFNGTRVSLADIPIYAVGASGLRCLYVGPTLTAIGAAAAELYCDNLYVGEYLGA